MCTSDTIEHDIAQVGDDIGVFNLCSDTTRHLNGVVTNMHPSEGVWLFRCVSSAIHRERQQEHRSSRQQEGDDPCLMRHYS